MSSSQNATPPSNLGISVLFGGLSCVVASFFTHPIDSIKVRLQLRGERGSQSQGGNIVLYIIRTEGIMALYQGLSASLLREATYSTIRMGLYDPFKTLLSTEEEKKSNALPHWKKIVAGGCSGMLGSAIANPTDLLKVRFQAHIGRSEKGLYQTALDIVRSEGVIGLYRGVIPTTQRAIILTATQLSSYDQTKEFLLQQRAYFQEGIFVHFIASMTAGLAAASATSPIDLVKSRIMNQHFVNGKGVLYSSTLDCFAKTIRSEGFASLFKGFLPNWLRLGPHTIITFIVLEQLKKNFPPSNHH